ncbi:formate/nitrite transporter family protein [bacterium]|nr:formate/nitrite transporter family protein [bacterium]
MEEEKVISTQDSLTPSATVHELSDSVMTGKAGFSKTKMFTLAIAAGAFIAFGAQVSLTVMTGDSMMGWGFTKLIGAMTFATGLMIVALTGAELFTGNVMMTFAVLEKKVSLLKLLRSWTIVYIANFLGSILVAGLIFGAGMGHNGGDAVGVTAMQTAFSKINLTFGEAFFRGILCNWLVCLAIFMASTSKRVIGKIFAIFFPIMTFVASGYEHSVANMFFIPNGLLMKHFPSIVAASGMTPDQLATMTWKGFFLHNLLPVTCGNIVGAFVFVVLLFWTAYLREEHRHQH